MFNLFKKKCPVDLREKVWTERRLIWLIDEFGLQRMLDAEFVLPTTEYFPEQFDGSKDQVRSILDRVCRYMSVDPEKLQLHFYRDAERPSAAGMYERGETSTIHIAESQLNDLESLISTLAHEVAHEILLGGGRLQSTESDHEWVTDLTTAFLGIGLFAANTAVRQANWHYLNLEYTSIRKLGYLPSRIYGYAFALFAWIRNEQEPHWERYLRTDPRRAFNDGVRYLRHSNNSLIRPDNAVMAPQHRAMDVRISDLAVLSESVRLSAIWDIRDSGEASTDAMNALIDNLSDGNAIIRDEAASALGTIGSASIDAVPALMNGLQDRIKEVRAQCAAALGKIQPPLETADSDGEQLRDKLVLLLDDPSTVVVDAAVDAMAMYGAEFHHVAPRLMRPLVTAIVTCDFNRMTRLLKRVAALVPDIKTYLEESLKDQEPEIRGRALAAVDEM